MDRPGFEPGTNRLKAEYSTIELAILFKLHKDIILNLNNNSEVAGELGPLKYLSGLTDTPMDVIINILLLTIIFVFDPLAIALVVAANFAFANAYPKRVEDIYGEVPEEDNSSIFPEDYDENRMNIIGQNGNDGKHYGLEPTEQAVADFINAKEDEDWKVVDETTGDFKDFEANYAKYMIVDKSESAINGLKLLHFLRSKNIPCILYPDNIKLKKQLKYAHSNKQHTKHNWNRLFR